MHRRIHTQSCLGCARSIPMILRVVILGCVMLVGLLIDSLLLGFMVFGHVLIRYVMVLGMVLGSVMNRQVMIDRMMFRPLVVGQVVFAACCRLLKCIEVLHVDTVARGPVRAIHGTVDKCGSLDGRHTSLGSRALTPAEVGAAHLTFALLPRRAGQCRQIRVVGDRVGHYISHDLVGDGRDHEVHVKPGYATDRLVKSSLQSSQVSLHEELQLV